MPSLLHEGLLELVRFRPAFVLEVLSELLSFPVSDLLEGERSSDNASTSDLEVRVAEGDLTEPLPTEYRADLVTIVEHAGKAVLGIVLEAQLRRDADKRMAWPMYAAGLRARLGCPVVVLVICPRASTARWAAKPIALGGASVFAPLVVGPKGIPVVTEPERAARSPELAMLSAVAHATSESPTALAVLRCALHGIESLPDNARVLYCAILEALLPEPLKQEIRMNPEPVWMRAPSIQRLMREAKEEGEAAGQAAGQAAGEAAALLTVLEARGLSPTDEERERIQSCTDPEQLTRWVRAAVTAEDMASVFKG